MNIVVTTIFMTGRVYLKDCSDDPTLNLGVVFVSCLWSFVNSNDLLQFTKPDGVYGNTLFPPL